MKKVIAAVIALAAIVLPSSAIAQYNSPHKYTDAFGKTKIYISGDADTIVDVITESSKEYTFHNNLCGWISLRESSTRKVKAFSSTLASTNFSNVSISSVAPYCIPDGPASLSIWEGPGFRADNYSAPFTTLLNNSLGASVKVGNSFSIKVRNANFTGSAPISLQGTVTYENTIKNKINSCGFGTITVSANRPMIAFKIAGVDYTLANLPVVEKPIICRTQGVSKIRYVPLN